MDVIGMVIVIAMAMGFNYTNGFHDAANAIATSVSTRALTPRVALIMAAFMNLIGSFFGAEVAKTVGSGIVDLPEGTESLVVVFAALTGAIAWNLITWWYGLPSSSSYALIGGLVGATLVYSVAGRGMGRGLAQGGHSHGDLPDRRLRHRLRLHGGHPVGLPEEASRRG